MFEDRKKLAASIHAAASSVGDAAKALIAVAIIAVTALILSIVALTKSSHD
jgi:hypothetical protein